MSTVNLSLDDLRALTVRAFVASNTTETNAQSVADALVHAEADGQSGHGISRIPSYAGQSKSSKVDGHAVPEIVSESASAIRIDACSGFAYPALDLAHARLSEMAHATGIAAAGVFRSHHCGAAGYHVERLADKGLIAFLFANTPKAIAPWGGREALFGTNPIAFAAPRRNNPALVIDLSLSKVARGKIMVAAQEGRPIPEGWAFDSEGKPITDAKAALAGTMAPMGDAKGAALVMMVEILAAALTGANFGFESSSFFDAEGPSPAVGQTLITLDPDAFSGGAFADRLETMIQAVFDQPGARLPGSRRIEAREKAHADGVEIAEALYKNIRKIAGE
ncbi:MAG: Ldh family oxidoreductase [Rhodospirillales bacterium]|nr:Ldh family oxidoreductase [Rhodospirillales bacterium]